MELIDLQGLEDFKSNFLAYHILNFYKNHKLSFGRFPKLITHTQLVVRLFATTYRCKQFFVHNETCCIRNYQVITCFTFSFCQPLHLTLISHFPWDQTDDSLINWLLTCEFSGVGRVLLVLLRSPLRTLQIRLELKRLCSPVWEQTHIHTHTHTHTQTHTHTHTHTYTHTHIHTHTHIYIYKYIYI